MVELDRDRMERAISRCRQVRPLVAAMNVEARQYLVESSDRMTMYTVRLVCDGGRKYADCPCKAGRSGMMCYHAVAAATLHVGLMRQQATPAAPQPTPKARPSGFVYDRHYGWTVDGWQV